MAMSIPAMPAFAKYIALLSFVTACASHEPHPGQGDTGSAATPRRIPAFAAFPSGRTYRESPASINFASDPDSRRFRSVLEAGIRSGPNLAGHFRIVTWGCGTQCRSYAIVDVASGRIFGDSALDFDCHDPEFRVDSRLVVEVADTAVFGPCSRGDHYYAWNDSAFVEMK